MRWLTRFLAALLALYAIGFLWPFLRDHSEQDTCSFGPVTNAEYRALLEKVEPSAELRDLLKAPITNGTRPKMQEGYTASIRRNFERLVPPDASLFFRLAAMHAVVRGHGGELRSAAKNMTMANEGVDPFEIAFKDFQRGRTVGVIYYYYISEPGLRIPFYPLDGRDVKIIITYYLFSGSLWGEPFYDRFRFAALRWIPWDHGPPEPVSNRRPNCPPIPSPDWLERYTATFDTLKEP